ncbi:1-phosphofructokinase [Reinekea forsetii]|nr:1-phosphofructokinase [Reinekea forsetii]
MIYTLTLNPAVDLEYQVKSFDLNSVTRASSCRMDAGGKGFNVSRMLAQLDMVSTAVGFIGGHSGARLEAALKRQKIETNFCDIAGESRTNVSFVREGSSDHYKVNDPGPEISAFEVASLYEKVSRLALPGDWWILAGSVPPGVPLTVYAELIRLLKQKGAQVFLDSSGDAFKLACSAQPTLIKPNLEEAEELLGLPKGHGLSLKEISQKLIQLGPEKVVISLGKDGACCFDGSSLNIVKSPNIVEKNPVGAGDSLVAGMVWGLFQGDALPIALKKGIACGAATASIEGTGLGTLEQVQQLMARVDVQ